MNMQRVKTCFTITFTDDQFAQARRYIEDMKHHPRRIFWEGKEGKNDEELIMGQIAHRILSGFYNDNPLAASRQIMAMESNLPA